MKAIFFFDEMLTPKIITLVYWAGLAGVLISSIGMIFGGSLVWGIGTLIFGAISTRIFSELLIVLFKIHENLQKLASKE